MQVKVPKFIDIEDRVIFNITWKQFLALGLSALAAFLFYKLLQSYIGFPLALLALTFGGALAFVRPNGRPFGVFLKAIWRYNFYPRRYIWNKETLPQIRKLERPEEQKTEHPEQEKIISARKKQEQLKHLAQQLDIHKTLNA